MDGLLVVNALQWFDHSCKNVAREKEEQSKGVTLDTLVVAMGASVQSTRSIRVSLVSPQCSRFQVIVVWVAPSTCWALVMSLWVLACIFCQHI